MVSYTERGDYIYIYTLAYAHRNASDAPLPLCIRAFARRFSAFFSTQCSDNQRHSLPYVHVLCRCPCVTQFCAGWYQSPLPCTDATHSPIMGAHTKRFVLLFQSLQLADFVDNQCQYQQPIINAKSKLTSHPHATHAS